MALRLNRILSVERISYSILLVCRELKLTSLYILHCFENYVRCETLFINKFISHLWDHHVAYGINNVK